MKITKAIQSARYSLIFSGILFFGLILGNALPSIYFHVLLDPYETLSGHWHRLFTYWLFPIHFGSWFWVSFLIISAGIIIERTSPGWVVLLLAITGILLGGVLFVILNPDEVPFAGSGIAAGAFGGSALMIVLLSWKQSHFIARIYAIFLILFFSLNIFSVGEHSPALPIILTAVWGIVFTAVYQRRSKHRNKINVHQ